MGASERGASASGNAQIRRDMALSLTLVTLLLLSCFVSKSSLQATIFLLGYFRAPLMLFSTSGRLPAFANVRKDNGLPTSLIEHYLQASASSRIIQSSILISLTIRRSLVCRVRSSGV